MTRIESGPEKQTPKSAEPLLAPQVYSQNLEQIFPAAARIANGEDPAKVMRANRGDCPFEGSDGPNESKREIRRTASGALVQVGQDGLVESMLREDGSTIKIKYKGKMGERVMIGFTESIPVDGDLTRIERTDYVQQGDQFVAENLPGEKSHGLPKAMRVPKFYANGNITYEEIGAKPGALTVVWGDGKTTARTRSDDPEFKGKLPELPQLKFDSLGRIVEIIPPSAASGREAEPLRIKWKGNTNELAERLPVTFAYIDERGRSHISYSPHWAFPELEVNNRR
jgi:hypothetical protein